MKYLKTIVAAGLAVALVTPAAVMAAEGSSAKVAAGSSTKGNLVPIKIVLPNPQFEGTPKPTKSANLERPKPPGWKRPPFLAPKGTHNLALHKKVTASDDLPIIGDTDFVTDGDKEGSDGSFVEFGPGRQYVQIDLGEECEIYAIVVWHYHAEARVYHDVIVQISDDKKFVKGVKTVFNNDHDNSSSLGAGKDKEYIENYQGRLIPVKSVHGRYVRLYSNGSTSNEMNHYIEVEVYGKTLKELAKK